MKICLSLSSLKSIKRYRWSLFTTALDTNPVNVNKGKMSVADRAEVELLLEKLQEYSPLNCNADGDRAKDIVVDISELLSDELTSIDYGETDNANA